MKALIGLGVILAIAAAIVLPQTFFVVDETQLAIVTRFGEFRRSHTEPGLRVKVPFVESTSIFDSRLLRTDAPPESLLTADKRNLVIDAYGRYRIVDPLLFFETLRSELQADSRVGDLVASELRREVALDNQSEIISETREPIMERITRATNRFQVNRNEVGQFLEDGLNDPELILRIAKAGAEGAVRERDATSEEREALIREANPPILADEGLSARYFIPLRKRFGVNVVDVRIKRADFPEQIATSVFSRMEAERERIASRLRAEGAEEDAEIRADVDREVQVIRQQAQGDGAQIRGEGEQRAIEILADALEKDPDFFAFRRSLETYTKTLENSDTLVLSSDSPLFRFLEDPLGQSKSQRKAGELASGQ